MDWKEQLELFEQTGQWREAVVLIRRVTDEHPVDVEVYVRALFVLLNLLLEEDYASHGFEHDALAHTKSLRTMLSTCFSSDTSWGWLNGISAKRR